MSLPSESILHGRLRSWRRQLLVKLLLEGGLRSVSVFFGAVLLLAACDRLFAIPQAGRIALFAVEAILAAAAVFKFLAWPIFSLSRRSVLEQVQQSRPSLRQHLMSAWEFSRGGTGEGVSEDLVQAHMTQTERLLVPAELEKIFSIRPSAAAASTALLCAALFAAALRFGQTSQWERVLAPWRELPLEELLWIEPKDARLAWGKEVNIQAGWKAPSQERVELHLKSDSEVWQAQKWDFEEGGRFVYRISELTENLEYRLRWKDARSPAYKLTPVPYPQFAEMRYRVNYPAYTRRPDEEFSGGGDLSATAGSRVIFLGKPSAPLKTAALHWGDGSRQDFRLTSAGDYQLQFIVRQNATFYWRLDGADGISDPEPVVHELFALPDEPPSIDLVSPAFEVAISPLDPLPVFYAAGDDFGLTDIQILIRQVSPRPSGVPNVSEPGEGVDPGAAEGAAAPPAHPGPRSSAEGAARAFSVQRFSPSDAVVKEQNGHFAWDLSEFGFGVLEMSLRAIDNRSPQPQMGESAKNRLYLIDFDQMHDSVQEQMGALHGLVENLASKEKNLRERLEKIVNNLESGSEWGQMSSEADAEWKEAAASFEKLVEAMEQDPYTDPGMVEAFRKLAENFDFAQERLLPQSRQAAQSQDWKKAQQVREVLSRELDKARKWMAEGRNFQQYKDLASQSERMSQAGEDLKSSLQQLEQSGEAPSPETLERLEKSLEKIREQMQALAERIEQIPKKKPQTPEEEAQQKIYQVPIGDAQSLSAQLDAALRRGDWQKAAVLAERLSRELEKIRNTLAEAAQGAHPMSRRDNLLSQEMEQARALWQEVAEQQSRSVRQIQQLEDERLKRLLEAQKELLKELETRQASLIAKAGGLSAALHPETLRLMNSVLREFAQRRVVSAPDNLSRILQGLQAESGRRFGSLDKVLASTETAAALRADALMFSGVMAGEAEILELLRKEIKSPPSTQKEMEDFRAAGRQQGETYDRAKSLAQKMRDLSSKSVALPPSVSQNLDSAQEDMALAQKELEALQSPPALEHAANALEKLAQGMEQMESASREQKSMESGMERSGAGRPRTLRQWTGGRMGTSVGPVELPSDKEYRPPQEVRQEVMQSLQEKYPKAYEQGIKDYFKQITK
ncbi:MAG: hypothetical protein A3G41_00980 [Elusimicrobia bacterium RIFCSPLOWO2_12_FULL_59_9]|nr:MAG: hypothetical protein A3G41_00980 [Elusimicrobia bacterium RIFCSPLOWO2_12_FULL_59_9]